VSKPVVVVIARLEWLTRNQLLGNVAVAAVIAQHKSCGEPVQLLGLGSSGRFGEFAVRREHTLILKKLLRRLPA